MEDRENLTESGSGSDLYLENEPADLGNNIYIKKRVTHLGEKYSHDELSGLTPQRLEQEEENLLRDFSGFVELFPKFEPHDLVIPRVIKGNDYRGLEPLTVDQQQMIRDCKSECIGTLTER